MSSSVLIEIEMPDNWDGLQLPAGVQYRLQTLLDRQDHGIPLTEMERKDAEGLVDMAEWLSLLRLRANRVEALPTSS